MKNKNNTRLTLKALKEQLDKLQNNHNANINTIKSSFKIIYLISLLGYIIGKIPFLNKYIKGIKSIVAKTSIWTVLVILRKTFIIMNALIGMWLIFKITGWSEFSFIGFVSTFGNAYIDIFSSFCIKAFNWIYELFDTKIVPDVPSDKPRNPWSQTTGWNVRPMSQPNYMDIAESAKSWYSSPAPQPSNDLWLTSWKTWAFIGGSIITIFALYTGYVYVSDWFKGPDANNVNIQAPPQAPDGNAPRSLIKTAIDVLVLNRLANISNGLYYIKESILPSMSKQDFGKIQYNDNVPMDQKLQQYWPFTTYHPAESWYHRLKIKIIGESEAEYELRKIHLEDIRRRAEITPVAPVAPEFIQGSSSNPLINTPQSSPIEGREMVTVGNTPDFSPMNTPKFSPIKLGFPDLPPINTKPVQALPQELLPTISYPSNTSFVGDIKSPIQAEVGFMDKLKEVITATKLENIPKTPVNELNNTNPILTPEAIANIDNAAASGSHPNSAQASVEPTTNPALAAKGKTKMI